MCDQDLHPSQAESAAEEKWPTPTVPRPDIEEMMMRFLGNGVCEATDGCAVEVDGVCIHGHPSWFHIICEDGMNALSEAESYEEAQCIQL